MACELFSDSCEDCIEQNANKYCPDMIEDAKNKHIELMAECVITGEAHGKAKSTLVDFRVENNEILNHKGLDK